MTSHHQELVRRLLASPTKALLYLAALRSGVDLSELPGGEALADERLEYDAPVVLEVGAAVLARHASAIRNDLERFSLYEQLFLAAIDVNDLARAREYLALITGRFPKAAADGSSSSSRVQRLVGMLAEAEGDLDGAQAAYAAGLAADEASAPLSKRAAALHAARGDRGAAIAALAAHVDHYAQDAEAWTQLAELYLLEGMPQQAAFCLEELLVLRPASYLLRLRYADLARTLRRPATALRFYAAALEARKDCVRALYGVRAVAADLLAVGGNAAPGKGGGRDAAGDADAEAPPPETLRALHELAGDRLRAVYAAAAEGAASGHERQASAEQLAVVTAWLQDS
ncbi:ER membrane complex subunit 2 [Cladochytrium tenue]|nr:ER membrane complex subunit 2 [Cladochytrium tenue]